MHARHRAPAARSTALLLTLCSCVAGKATAPTPTADPPHAAAPSGSPQLDEEHAAAVCRALLAARPEAWPECWRAAHALGERASPELIAQLEAAAGPSAPGAQAAVHLLGVLRDPQARLWLIDTVEGRGDLAAEAALSLGEIGDRRDVDVLAALMADRAAAVMARNAAAASLIQMGQEAQTLPFVRAVFLAATPYAADSTREQGLPPHKTRWAHERTMLLRAITNRFDGRTFGLDEDAPWEHLRAGVGRLSAAFAGAR